MERARARPDVMARAMFVRLSRITRWRMARLLAVFYALCVLAPAAAFAFGDGANAAHCLTEANHHGVQAVQVLAPVHAQDHAQGHAQEHADQMHRHGDGAMHLHQQQAAVDHDTKSDHGTRKSVDAQCCGLICLTALPATDLTVGIPAVMRAPVVLSRPDEIAGQSPARLDRPPNPSLPS